jgi:hypothetical protein
MITLYAESPLLPVTENAEGKSYIYILPIEKYEIPQI